MKKIKQVNTAKRVKIILEEDPTPSLRKVYTASERMSTITMDIDSMLDEVRGSKKEGAHWAYLTIGIVAYNIVNWIKRLALPSMYKKKLIKALRYRFFNIAARIVRHGRYIVMKLAQGIHRFTDIFHAYERILSLQFR